MLYSPTLPLTVFQPFPSHKSFEACEKSLSFSADRYSPRRPPPCNPFSEWNSANPATVSHELCRELSIQPACSALCFCSHSRFGWNCVMSVINKIYLCIHIFVLKALQVNTACCLRGIQLIKVRHWSLSGTIDDSVSAAECWRQNLKLLFTRIIKFSWKYHRLQLAYTVKSPI